MISSGAPPKQEIHEFFESDEDWIRIIKGDARLFFYGTFIYGDVFGGSHTTGFAHELKGSAFTTVGQPGEQNYND